MRQNLPKYDKQFVKAVFRNDIRLAFKRAENAESAERIQAQKRKKAIVEEKSDQESGSQENPQ